MSHPVRDFRQWHYLRPLKENPLPEDIIFFDSETLPTDNPNRKGSEIHRLRLWAAHYVRLSEGEIIADRWHNGTTIQEFWQMVEDHAKAKRSLWLICHNAGFDTVILGMWEMVSAGRLELRQDASEPRSKSPRAKNKGWSGFACIDGPPTIVKARLQGTKKTIIVVDSLNWFRCALEKLGGAAGEDKGPMPAFTASDSVWLEHCRRDVRVVEGAVLGLIRWVRDERLGGLGWTVGSQAMNAFRARFLQEKSILIHGQREAIELERDAYMGGLAQCWFRGRIVDPQTWFTEGRSCGNRGLACWPGPVYALDASAFYPSLMGQNLFPAELLAVTESPGHRQVSYHAQQGDSLARVRLRCSGIGFPVRHQGHTTYAVGEFWTTLCGPELQRAEEEKAITECTWLCTYRLAPLFADWARWCAEQRELAKRNCNAGRELYAKLLANSLFGKFGQHRERWVDRPDVLSPIPLGHFHERSFATGAVETYRSLGWLAQMQAERCEHPDSFPAISAWVCAHGRERVVQWRRCAGVENCLYSDTDSLHVLETGFDRLCAAGWLNSAFPGALRLTETALCADYRGPKDYSLNERDVVAGIKSRARRLSARCWEQQEFQSLISAVHAGGAAQVEVRNVRITRNFTPCFGRPQSSGHILPLMLPLSSDGG